MMMAMAMMTMLLMITRLLSRHHYTQEKMKR
jgi:hypothetical protein